MLYLTFVLRSVFEVCNFELGPFYNYPFSMSVSWPCRPVSGQDRGMTIFFRPIIAIIGPGALGLDQSWFLSLLSPDTRPGAMEPLAISFSRPGLSLPSNCRSDQLCSQEISQPKQGCYVGASAIRLHHLYPVQKCAQASAYLGRASLGLTRKFVLTPLTRILLEITAHFCA